MPKFINILLGIPIASIIAMAMMQGARDSTYSPPFLILLTFALVASYFLDTWHFEIKALAFTVCLLLAAQWVTETPLHWGEQYILHLRPALVVLAIVLVLSVAFLPTKPHTNYNLPFKKVLFAVGITVILFALPCYAVLSNSFNLNHRVALQISTNVLLLLGGYTLLLHLANDSSANRFSLIATLVGLVGVLITKIGTINA